MILYLIRHGQTTWNDEGRLQGNIDTRLDQTGLKQAESAGEKLAKYPIEQIYCSDLQRAVQTGEIINRYLNAKIIVDANLREISYGKWEGKKWEEIKGQYDAYIQKWQLDRVNVPAPDGESFSDLEKRLMKVITSIMNQDLQHLAIITHAGVIKALICIFLGIGLENQAKFSFRNCSLSMVKLNLENRQAQIVCLNDFSHLDNNPI